MPTVTGIVVISSRICKGKPAHLFTKYTSSRSPCQEIFLIYFGGGSLPLPAALPFCHPGAEGDRVQGKSSGHPLCGRTALGNLLPSAHGPRMVEASIAGPATPRSPAQLLENFEEFKNHKLMRKSDSNMHNLHITFRTSSKTELVASAAAHTCARFAHVIDSPQLEVEFFDIKLSFYSKSFFLTNYRCFAVNFFDRNCAIGSGMCKICTYHIHP